MFEHFDWIQAMRSSPVMVIIICCSVLTAGFALERAIYYGSAAAIGRSPHRRDGGRAFGKPRGGPSASSSRTRTDGTGGGRDGEEPGRAEQVSEEKLHIALSEQRLQLERNLGFIGTMGNTAPLIGLLGTVWASCGAFHDMAEPARRDRRWSPPAWPRPSTTAAGSWWPCPR